MRNLSDIRLGWTIVLGSIAITLDTAEKVELARRAHVAEYDEARRLEAELLQLCFSSVHGRAPLPVWRVGRTVALNVYEGDRPVCQCHTEEDARRIVAAINSATAEWQKQMNEKYKSPGDRQRFGE